MSSARAATSSPWTPVWSSTSRVALTERVHLVGVRLRRVVGVFAAAMQRIAGAAGSEAAAFAVQERHAYT